MSGRFTPTVSWPGWARPSTASGLHRLTAWEAGQSPRPADGAEGWPDADRPDRDTQREKQP